MEILDMIDNYIGNDEEQDTLMEDVMDFLSLIDFDDLSEDQIHYLDVLLDHIDEYELNEKIKRVVRGGKKVKKKICKPGYKSDDDGKCVKMSSQEKKSRSKGAKKGAKKKKGQKASIARKRAKSMKKI